jgi:hypothetical protein
MFKMRYCVEVGQGNTTDKEWREMSQFKRLSRNKRREDYAIYSSRFKDRRCGCGQKISTQANKTITRCARCIRLARGE